MNRAISVLSLVFLLVSSAKAQSSRPATLSEGIEGLTENISNRLIENGIKRVAVVGFTDLNGYKSALGDFVAKSLISNLSNVSSARFGVVQRRVLAQVLEEQKLTESSIFDSRSIASVGKILGVQAIVIGTITYLGDNVEIDAQLIGVETALVLGAAIQLVRKDGAVESLINQGSGNATTLSSSQPLGGQIQRHDVYFQNRFLRVEVKSISKSKNKKTVTLALVFRNMAKEDILIAMYECDTMLVDNSGSSIGGNDVTGVPCIYSPHRRTQGDYSALDMGSQTTVLLTFKSSDEIEGNIFSFSAEMVRLKGKQWSQFTVGIPNIELR